MMGTPKENSPEKKSRKGRLKGIHRVDPIRGKQQRPRGHEHRGDGTLRGEVSIDVSQAMQKQTGQSIGWIPTAHFGERNGVIDTVVLHYTVTGGVEQTLDLFERAGEGMSAHYVIGKDGLIIQMVDVEKKAWHAGASEFQGRSDVNDFSIGVELVNWGLLKERDGVLFAWPGDYGTVYQGRSPVHAGGQWWDPFTEMQYRVLMELISQIRVHYPGITPDRIVGHGDIALPRGRKIDPGLAFNWERLKKGRGSLG